MCNESRNNIQMKKARIVLAVSLVLASCHFAVGQQEEEKVVVEITKDINGTKETFKGRYGSIDEMKADPKYREFAGEDGSFSFWLKDTDVDHIVLDFDRQKGKNDTFFKYFNDEDGEGSRIFFDYLNPDSSQSFFHFDMGETDVVEQQERLRSLGIEMEQIFEGLDQESEEKRITVLKIKHIKVEEVDKEFGKRGNVSEKNKLALEELAFYPNPSTNGRFKVQFLVPQEDELTIRVSNLEGKTIFTRYFERFSGTYKESIDLSTQQAGIYLLEIVQGKKRRVKKIVIE